MIAHFGFTHLRKRSLRSACQKAHHVIVMNGALIGLHAHLRASPALYVPDMLLGIGRLARAVVDLNKLKLAGFPSQPSFICHSSLRKR